MTVVYFLFLSYEYYIFGKTTDNISYVLRYYHLRRIKSYVGLIIPYVGDNNSYI